MIYPVYVYGSPVLRKVAENVPEDFPDLSVLAADMFETMYSSNGVGLAAPQIGKSIRMFVVDLAPYADEDPSYGTFKKVFINPEIYDSSEIEVAMGEGCLSLPGLNEDVYRPEKISVRYYDEHFNLHDETFDEFPARVIQHEYDHLDGVVFTDRVSALRKSLIRNKLSSMAKGKYTARYKTKQVR